MTRAGSPLKKLLIFRKLAAAFAVIVIFFFAYNTFLVDNTIEDLRFSLEQTAMAYDTKDLDGIDLLLSQFLVNEVVPEKIDAVSVGNLEYARNAIAGGKSYKVIDSVETSLNVILKEKEDRRSPILKALDFINRFFRKIIDNLVSALSNIFAGGEKEKLPPEGIDEIEKGKALESAGKFKEALAVYSGLLKKYPDSDRTSAITIRAASLHTRLRQYDSAIELYRQVVRGYAGKKEAYIARVLLSKLQEMKKLLAKTRPITENYAGISAKDKKELQEALYKLGTLYLQLLDMGGATEYFAKATSVNPSTDLAARSSFNAAWAKKEDRNMEEAVEEFKKLVMGKTAASIKINSMYQMADIRHKEGRYQDAIDIYIKIADESKGEQFAALCLFQAGASYLYDLNDSQKAQEIFSRLTKEYSGSLYSKFLMPDNPIGLFVTYLVPRATRVMTWRAGGLLALCGYSGPIAQFKVSFADEDAFNATFNDWLKRELPDTIGNLYVNITGAKVRFKGEYATGEGRITMGKFNIRGRAEGGLDLAKDGKVAVVLTKAYLERVPIPPVLINSSFSQLSFMIREHFPIIVTKIGMKKDDISIEGYGSKNMLIRVKKATDRIAGINMEIADIEDKKKEAELYKSLSSRFPENEFSPVPKLDPGDLFLDFFTRMYLYLGFKLLETVKDTKLDYRRSARTLGRLEVKKIKYKVSYKEAEINAALNRLIKAEFPWIIGSEYLFDITGLEVHFEDIGDVTFLSMVRLGRTSRPIIDSQVQRMTIEGRARFEIDEESRIPRMVYKNVILDGRPFPVERMNLVSLRCLNILKDGHIPFEVEELDITKGNITISGQGAADLIKHIFSDPQLFVMFQIREIDQWAAGIYKLKRRENEHLIYDKEMEEARRERRNLLREGEITEKEGGTSWDERGMMESAAALQDISDAGLDTGGVSPELRSILAGTSRLDVEQIAADSSASRQAWGRVLKSFKGSARPQAAAGKGPAAGLVAQEDEPMPEGFEAILPKGPGQVTEGNFEKFMPAGRKPSISRETRQRLLKALGSPKGPESGSRGRASGNEIMTAASDPAVKDDQDKLLALLRYGKIMTVRDARRELGGTTGYSTVADYLNMLAGEDEEVFVLRDVGPGEDDRDYYFHKDRSTDLGSIVNIIAERSQVGSEAVIAALKSQGLITDGDEERLARKTYETDEYVVPEEEKEDLTQLERKIAELNLKIEKMDEALKKLDSILLIHKNTIKNNPKEPGESNAGS